MLDCIVQCCEGLNFTAWAHLSFGKCLNVKIKHLCSPITQK